MNSKKQISALLLSLVLCFTMLFTYVPQNAYADPGPYTLTFRLAEGGRLWDYETLDTNDGAYYDHYLFGLNEPGNSFKLEPSGSPEVNIYYIRIYNDERGWIEGFYPYGNPDLDPVEVDTEKDNNGVVLYGLNHATLEITYNGEKYSTYVPFRGVRRVHIKFSKAKYYYDGKTHTPSYKLINDVSGTTVPSSDYKAVWDKGRKNVGYYLLNVKYDTSKDYPDDGYEGIEIYPNKPVITKITPGKKKMTVKWKKFTKSQQKQIKKFKIEYSTDKKFRKNVKTVTAKKNSYYKTIKKLKRKKTYYVRVIAIGEPHDPEVDWLNTQSKAKKTKVK